MIATFSHLPSQARYEMINMILTQTHGSVNDTAALFDGCPNTVRLVTAWEAHLTALRHQGAPNLLQSHHILYIEARMIQNRTMTSEQLARELVTSESDLPRCSARTIERCRKRRGLHASRMRHACHMSDAAPRNRVLWCQRQSERETHWNEIIRIIDSKR
jgi:hypothetical protein